MLVNYTPFMISFNIRQNSHGSISYFVGPIFKVAGDKARIHIFVTKRVFIHFKLKILRLLLFFNQILFLLFGIEKDW